MSPFPLVSIIIPAYNKADYTVRCVKSVLNQTYSPLEIIVVDDGSSDKTIESLECFGDKIQLIKKKNGGACSARNEGIRQARGEVLAFLDCDDLYDPLKIKLSIDYLQQFPTVGMVHTDAYFIDKDDKVTGQYQHPKRLLVGKIAPQLVMGNFICNSTVVIKKSIIDTAGLFDETLFPPADWDMWLRCAKQTETGFIDQPLTKYRVTDNFIINRLDQAWVEEEIVVKQYFEHNLVDSHLKLKALSNLHLRFGQSYWVKEIHSKSTYHLIQAIKLNPLNWKAWVLLIGKVVVPGFMLAKLRQRILRTA